MEIAASGVSRAFLEAPGKLVGRERFAQNCGEPIARSVLGELARKPVPFERRIVDARRLRRCTSAIAVSHSVSTKLI